MAEKVKQVDVIKLIADIIKTEFDCTVYSDEVLRNFTKPCFFIKFLATNTPQTVNFTSKVLSVVLTYFPKDNMRNNLHYLEIFDRVEALFEQGIKLKDRFLHTDEITEQRAGEEEDILQITITFPYLDKIIKQRPNSETAGEINVHYIFK